MEGGKFVVVQIWRGFTKLSLKTGKTTNVGTGTGGFTEQSFLVNIYQINLS